MRRLWPDPGEVADLAALVAADARPLPAGRPWLLVNMVSSLDGAISVAGRSGALGGPGDKAMFAALRGVADVVLAGAGTVRAEHYGPPRPAEAIRSARRSRGQSEVPRIAIVTRSLELDLDAALFTQADAPPFVLTCAASDAGRRRDLSACAEVVVAGEDVVDLRGALGELRARGVGVVTCEGGPSLNGDLLAAELVDEWNLTLSPLLVGGQVGRASRGPDLDGPAGMRLDRLLADEELLLGRWLRTAEPAG